MEANKILEASYLDILFDKKNKEYGAYQLRKSYNKRLATALVGMSTILLLFFLGSVLAKAMENKIISTLPITDTLTLIPVDNTHKPAELPPPPPIKVVEPPHVKTVDFTPPLVTKDEEMDDTQKPPEVTAIDISTIGLANKPDGEDDDGSLKPPPIVSLEKGTGLTVAPIKNESTIFTKVEIEAKFKGGKEAWARYLERNLQYPEAAIENGTQATVQVQLVVDKDGKVSDVRAINNPGDGLAEEAVRIIKKCPDWIPAEQNGNKVAYRFVQTVTFMIQ